TKKTKTSTHDEPPNGVTAAKGPLAWRAGQSHGVSEPWQHFQRRARRSRFFARRGPIRDGEGEPQHELAHAAIVAGRGAVVVAAIALHLRRAQVAERSTERPALRDGKIRAHAQ